MGPFDAEVELRRRKTNLHVSSEASRAWYFRSLLSAKEAICATIASVTPCEHEADVLFAFYEADSPCLLVLNTLHRTCREVDGLIQLGSQLPAGQHEWTEKFVSSLLTQLDQFDPHPLHTERAFTNLVALLQSYGIHDYLLQYGVGGAFVAAWVTPAGARWQGNHLHVIHGEIPAFEDPMCATMIQDDVVCLINNQTDSIKILTWRRPGDGEDVTALRIESAAAACTAAWDNGKFDYFVSLNNAKHIVTVVEMCKQQHHELVSMHASNFDDRLGIVWTPDLIDYSSTIAGVEVPDPGHMSMWFFPFKGIDEKMQRAREQFGWEQFGWEQFVDWNGEPGGHGI
jgi:hypothetical protein